MNPLRKWLRGAGMVKPVRSERTLTLVWGPGPGNGVKVRWLTDGVNSPSRKEEHRRAQPGT